MSQEQVTKAVAKKVKGYRYSGGIALEQIEHGIPFEDRLKCVFAIRDLLEAGRIRIRSKRVAHGFGWREMTTYEWMV